MERRPAACSDDIGYLLSQVIVGLRSGFTSFPGGSIGCLLFGLAYCLICSSAKDPSIVE
jgi:hypothetical protein